MENKEIYIDGVKVEECSYYNKDNTPYCCEVWDNECEAQNCYFKQCKRLEQENKELKEEIRFHNKENSSLLAERNAAQIGYDEIREVRERYRSALEEIRNDLKEVCKEECDYTKPKFCGDCDCRYGQILNKINEVLQCE